MSKMSFMSNVIKAARKAGIGNGQKHETLTAEEQQHNIEVASRYSASRTNPMQRAYWDAYETGMNEKEKNDR